MTDNLKSGYAVREGRLLNPSA